MTEKETIRKLAKAIKEAPSSFFSRDEIERETTDDILSLGLARFVIGQWNELRNKYQNEHFLNKEWQLDLLAVFTYIISSSFAKAERKEDYLKFFDYIHVALLAVGLDGNEAYLNKSIQKIEDILDITNSSECQRKLSNAIFGGFYEKFTDELLVYIAHIKSCLSEIL